MRILSVTLLPATYLKLKKGHIQSLKSTQNDCKTFTKERKNKKKNTKELKLKE